MKYTSFFQISALLLGLTVATLFLIYLTNRDILTVDFYANSGQPAPYVYTAIQHWVYVFSALYLVIKLLAITALFSTALYLNNCRVPFGKIWMAVTAAEYIFLVPAALKIYGFRHDYPNGGLEEWHRFYVLSALSIVKDVPADWIYPLQTLNVFEVAYWFILAFGLHKISGLTYDRSVRIVATTYLPALLIWVTGVVFCSLLLFPRTG